MKTYIIRFAYWLLKKCGEDVLVLSEAVVGLIPEATKATTEVELQGGYVSSEYKHAHAFGKILKRNPTAKKRDVGLAIEVALNGGV